MKRAMERWTVGLVAGNVTLGHASVRRGVFQRDSLTTLIQIGTYPSHNGPKENEGWV